MEFVGCVRFIDLNEDSISSFINYSQYAWCREQDNTTQTIKFI